MIPRVSLLVPVLSAVSLSDTLPDVEPVEPDTLPAVEPIEPDTLPAVEPIEPDTVLVVEPAGPEAPRLTLTPDLPGEGDFVRCVVGGNVHSRPRADTVFVASLAPGDPLLYRGLVRADGVLWVRTTTGYVEAARLDLEPEPVEGDLPVGHEGLVAGRVVPDDYEPSDLVVVPDSLKAEIAVDRNLRLRAGALRAFTEMIEAAREDGVVVTILSAYRTAEHQRFLYGRAVNGNPAQTTSAPPGRSEHRLGTTVDVSTPDVRRLDVSLEESPAGKWIAEHCEEHSIVVSFSRERHEARGIAFEPWHLRWVGENLSDESTW